LIFESTTLYKRYIFVHEKALGVPTTVFYLKKVRNLNLETKKKISRF
jgi:hypothetical protein